MTENQLGQKEHFVARQSTERRKLGFLCDCKVNLLLRGYNLYKIAKYSTEVAIIVICFGTMPFIVSENIRIVGFT